MLCTNCGSVQTPAENAMAGQPGNGRGSESSGKRVLRILLSVFLSLILFLSAFSAMLVAEIRMAFTEDGLNKMLSDISLEDIPLDLVLPDELENYDGMTDWLEDVIYNETQISVDISEQKLEQFLEESTIQTFLAGKLSAYTGSIFSGTFQEEVNKDEISELILENADLLEDIFDTEIGEQDVGRIADWFETSGTLEALSLPELTADKEVESALGLVHMLFSPVALGGLIALAVFMAVLLFVVNKKECGTALCFAGVPLILSGGLLGSLDPLTASLFSGLGGMELVGKLVQSIFSNGLILSLVVLAVGIVALVCGVVLKRIRRA